MIHQTKLKQLSAFVTEEEKEQIVLAAKKDRRSISSYIKNRILSNNGGTS